MSMKLNAQPAPHAEDTTRLCTSSAVLGTNVIGVARTSSDPIEWMQVWKDGIHSGGIVVEPRPSIAQNVTRQQTQTHQPLTSSALPCNDSDMQDKLLAAKLWPVLLLLATSPAAQQAFTRLQQGSGEEANVLRAFGALKDELNGLHVQLSTQRKFGCMLMVNLQELKQNVQSMQRTVSQLQMQQYGLTS